MSQWVRQRDYRWCVLLSRSEIVLTWSLYIILGFTGILAGNVFVLIMLRFTGNHISSNFVVVAALATELGSFAKALLELWKAKCSF